MIYGSFGRIWGSFEYAYVWGSLEFKYGALLNMCIYGAPLSINIWGSFEYACIWGSLEYEYGVLSNTNMRPF